MIRIASAFLALALFAGCDHDEEAEIVVYAAASMTDALGAAAPAYPGPARVRCAFASSSQLARQIEQGAPADLLVSADPDWIDWCADRGLVEPGSARDIATGELVLVAPRGEGFDVRFSPSFELGSAFEGRLAIADPEHVPAGRYAREALVHYGWYEPLEARLAPARDVRAALGLVERGASPLGVVYASDARASELVEIVGVFPPGSHPLIRYRAALVAGRGGAGAPFLEFLLGEEARSILRDHGLGPPAEGPP